MAVSGQLGQARQEDSTEDPADDSARISGARPAQGHYEPLPLGSEAFLCPLPPPVDADEQRGRGLLPWVVLSMSVLAASAAFAVALAVKSPAARPVESRSASLAQVRQPSAPAGEGARARDAAETGALAEGPASTEVAVASVVETAPPVAAPAAPPAAAATRVHPVRHRESLLQQPDRSQVVAALASVRPAVLACFGATHGVADAKITVVGRTGRITTAQISGQGGAIGSCMAREVRRARFPRFADPSLVISYPFAR